MLTSSYGSITPLNLKLVASTILRGTPLAFPDLRSPFETLYYIFLSFRTRFN